MVSALTNVCIMVCYAGFSHEDEQSDFEKTRIQLEYMELNTVTEQRFLLTGPARSIWWPIDLSDKA